MLFEGEEEKYTCLSVGWVGGWVGGGGGEGGGEGRMFSGMAHLCFIQLFTCFLTLKQISFNLLI